MLVADGETKAIVIPVAGEDPAEMILAYRRARALQAIRASQAAARRAGRSQMTLADINAEIRAVRRARASGDDRLQRG